MAHNFWTSLEYEASKSQLADNFYFNQLKVERVIRFDTGSNTDMEFQRADIDVQLHGWGKHANVSEKFRKIDYNDLYLELFSMYPSTKGWMKRNEADYLAYFFPKRVLWINKHDLHSFFYKEVEPYVHPSWLEEIQHTFSMKNGRIKKQLNNRDVYIVKAYNKTKIKTWDTLGITIPLDWVCRSLPNMKEYTL